MLPGFVGQPTVKKIPVLMLVLEPAIPTFDAIAERVREDPKYQFKPTRAAHMEQAIGLVRDKDYDVVLLNASPSAPFSDLLPVLRGEFPETPVIAYCPLAYEHLAMEAFAAGAQDYFLLEHLTDRSLRKTLAQTLQSRRAREVERYASRLRHTEVSLQKVITASIDGIVIVDRAGKVRFVNPMAEHFLGNRATALIGSDWAGTMLKKDPFEFCLTPPDGRQIHVHVQNIPIIWDDLDAHLITMRDITERVNLEKSKDDFLNTVSHELRTPLAIIKESAAQVLDGLHGAVAGAQEKILRMTLDSTQHLQKIVDDLLDVAKLEAGKVRLVPQSQDLAPVLEQLVDSFRPVAERKGLYLKSFVDGESTPFFFDRQRMIQVFSNLLGNAIKFTLKGGIEIRTVHRAGGVTCRIIDTGRGIAPKDLLKLFSKFEQFGSKKGDGASAGSGLGLSISKNLIELHGGTVEAESQIGAGSTFTVHFPKKTACEVFREQVAQEIAVSAKRGEPFSLVRLDNPHAEGRLADLTNYLRSDSDIVCRRDTVNYVLLPATPKAGAHVAIERVRRKFEDVLGGDPGFGIKVATYPEDGLTETDLFRALGIEPKEEACEEKS